MNMSNERTPRSNDERKDNSRMSDAFIPASVLPEPNPVEGWTFRWIRTSMVGNSDVSNVSKRFREGWVPVVKSEHPELQNLMSDVNSQFEGNVEIGGLLLCKLPDERAQARRDYQAEQNRRQMESVEEGFLNDNDSRMAKFNNSKSRSEFRRG
jgi:hypothetical protein